MRVIIFIILLLTACTKLRHYHIVDAKIDLSLAYYQQQVGNQPLAEHYYRRALREAPHLGEGHNNYGVLLCQQHHYQRAINQFVIAASEPSYPRRDQAQRNAKRCQQLQRQAADD